MGKFLFDLILYIPSTIFQLYRDGSSWVELVLSSRTQHIDAREARTLSPSVSSQTLYHCAPANGKVTTSQLDITNENQEVSLFPAGIVSKLS